MTRIISRLAIVLIGCIAMPSAFAYKTGHAALTTFCPLNGEAHGLCVSKHSGGTADRIQLECVLTREYTVAAIYSNIVFRLADNSQFNMPIHGALYDDNTFCTTNLSRYKHKNGKNLNPQAGTAMNCRYYQGRGESK